ncbi:MAG TPA: hypothetical protein VMU50_05640 [Polyangia bacterium]|nr:hypothetical protein [Polyangia bacterium]
MVPLPILPTLLAAAVAPGAAPAVSVPFRTDAAPRLDSLYGDATTLRAALDEFQALEVQMGDARDQLSTAVHETLAALPALETPGGSRKAPARACPAALAEPYARALAAGTRLLALGHRLQARYREIRRGEDGGDIAGLTPDYRWKARRAREQYARILTDYREMRVAFHDQLGAELRHAACKLAGRPLAAAPGSPAVSDDGGAPESLDPLQPQAWSLDSVEGPAEEILRPRTAAPRSPAAEPGGGASASAATPIWIDIDNSLCPQPTRVTIDGQAVGDVGQRAAASIRTRAGPHEICVLPASDQRACGAPGTVRKAYLHEGWSLTVHCGRQ